MLAQIHLAPAVRACIVLLLPRQDAGLTVELIALVALLRLLQNLQAELAREVVVKTLGGLIRLKVLVAWNLSAFKSLLELGYLLCSWLKRFRWNRLRLNHQ